MLKNLVYRILHPYRPAAYWHNIGPEELTERLSTNRDLTIQQLKKLQFHTVFEIGIGEGHVTEAVLNECKISKYDACDMSPVRQHEAAGRLAQYPQFTSVLEPFQTIRLNHQYDMILALQCLMHIPPRDMKSIIAKMIRHAKKYVVNVDYYNETKERLAPHCFGHDYGELYGRHGWQTTKINLLYRRNC